MPIWNYQTKTFEVQDDRRGEHTTSVLGGKFCYAVNLRGQQSGFIIGAVDLPGPGVRERTGNFDPESLYVIGPGHRVNLEIKCGQYDQQVREALTPID